MAEDHEPTASPGDAPLPPPGEPIHLPDPSFLPVLVSAGITIVLVGVILNWLIFGLGAAITLVAIMRWVGQARAEMAELPLEH